MDIAPAGYLESIKRCWRRRRYQRVDVDSRKRVKVVRLGNGKKAQRRVWRLKFVKRLRFKVLSPAKLFEKFHDAYVDMMLSLVGESKDENKRLSSMKTRVAEGSRRPVPVVASGRNEVVDSRMVMEIYKRLVSSRELSSMLVE